jgi:hypothetical protein
VLVQYILWDLKRRESGYGSDWYFPGGTAIITSWECNLEVAKTHRICVSYARDNMCSPLGIMYMYPIGWPG